MKKIAIFQSDLGVGGIQKSLINLLNNLDFEKYQVDLFLNDQNRFFAQELNKKIMVRYCGKYPFLSKFIYFDVLRQIASGSVTKEQYDVAIDFNSYQNECAVGALSINASKRIMWIHNDVQKKMQEDLKYRILWHFFKGKLRRFDEFVAVSDGIVSPFCNASGIQDKRISVIPNYIDTDEIMRKKQEKITFQVDESKYNLATMGRLCHQKGFDILIGHMAEVIKQRPDIKLYIIGEGPDKAALRQQIREQKLENHVELLGNLTNPFPYLDKMDGFALTSRYEGQGMVIWEALALGLKVFVSKNLEQYNRDIKGCDDIVSALVSAEKQKKEPDRLFEYNGEILKKFAMLVEHSKHEATKNHIVHHETQSLSERHVLQNKRNEPKYTG